MSAALQFPWRVPMKGNTIAEAPGLKAASQQQPCKGGDQTRRGT